MPPRVLTRASLAAVAARLAPLPPARALPPHTAADPRTGRAPREAAVLVPLCNVDGAAHVMLETDLSLAHTALRETHEELGLAPTQVELLGTLGLPEYSLGNRARVWAYVGFVHAASVPPQNLDADTEPAGAGPLPSLDLAALRPQPAEVAAVLPLPLSALADPARRTTHYFRLDAARPYAKVRAGDYAVPTAAWTGPGGAGGDARLAGAARRRAQRGADLSADLEVWGLSGWFLSQLAERCGWTTPLPPYTPDS